MVSALASPRRQIPTAHFRGNLPLSSSSNLRTTYFSCFLSNQGIRASFASRMKEGGGGGEKFVFVSRLGKGQFLTLLLSGLPRINHSKLNSHEKGNLGRETAGITLLVSLLHRSDVCYASNHLFSNSLDRRNNVLNIMYFASFIVWHCERAKQNALDE